MTTGSDPYRTLGLTPAASIDDIRRAYRRLAKANHPDSAGEAALPRFLAIQAAYEALVDGPAREAWRADPGRARAGRGPGRRPASSSGAPSGSDGTGPTWGPGSPGRRRPGARAGSDAGSSTAGAGPSGSPFRASRPGDEPGRPKRRSRPARPSNRATPGSTTYDAAEDEPFEPEWSGGTWYGSSSGTYWTINPKEYADPRKHGPEYQRRARRGQDATPGTDESAEPDEAIEGETFGAGESRQPGQAWTSGWTDEPAMDGAAAGQPRSASDGARRPGSAGAARPSSDSGSADRGLIGLISSGFGGRIALALLGWPPIGLVASAIAGEASGCSRFAASCVDVFAVGTWLVQLAIIAVLLALPTAAAVSAVGTLVALGASIPAAVLLSASGGSREPAASAAVLAAVLAVAYVLGVAVGIVRRGHLPRVP